MELDGRSLTVPAVAAFASDGGLVTCAPSAWSAVQRAHATLADLSSRRPVYGVSTGVGANRSVAVPNDTGHALRLLSSHAVGVGPVEDDGTTRAAMLVRLNQLLAGGSGVSPALVSALASATGRALPTLHRYGSIGTGDLSALAELALTLTGYLPWRSGDVDPVALEPTDALAFISSNAVTTAVAALACVDLQRLVRAAQVVAALSLRALRGTAEAYADAVHRAAPPGQAASAAVLRRLLDGPATAAVRIQDPFGLRAVPQVHGAALDALARLSDAIDGQLNTAGENPLVVPESEQVLHHAQFHTATLAAALDGARAALHPCLALSTSRLAALVEPGLTGLTPFLAQGSPGSSGVMMLEYVAHDALAEVRQTLLSVSVGGAVVSRGLEEHASFSTQSARATTAAAGHAPVVLACELVAAVRAVRADPDRLGSGPVADAFAVAAQLLDPEPYDRSLGNDVASAVAVLPVLAELAP